MKRFFLPALLALSLGAAAQPAREDIPQVILTQRASFSIVYGGPTRAEGRSYNFTPSFFIYPDAKLDEAGAKQLLADLDIQPLLDANYGTAVVINPTGDKYDAEKDFEAFAKVFNMFRGPGNLKVVGFGNGATFVNQVIAPKAGNQIADILTVGGKPGKEAKPVPAYVAGKGAAKVAKPYQKAIEPCAGEPLLQVVVNPDAKASAKDIFADAWKQVLGKNYRFNNYGHWNFQPTARIMWEYFKQFRRDPETKKLIYCP